MRKISLAVVISISAVAAMAFTGGAFLPTTGKG
jgi:hypothetical protein